jgi:hypothetical protein
VGIVMSLEASRLARNSPDWHNLMYMSRYTTTLIADEHGVYDPRDATDRMVLGLRGQMSELELDTSIRRMQEGRWNKAKRGELLLYPPAGYEIDELDRLVITHDESVREAIATVFAKFDELKSGKSVCTWFQEQGLEFPVRNIELRGHPVVWRAPSYRMVLRTLHHPIYAGAYVFGRTRHVNELNGDNPQTLQVRQVSLPQQDWAVLLHDHHDGYICWQQYEDNQELLRGNQQMKSGEQGDARGPAREGWALLQGLVRCGGCGRPMNVSYGGNRPSARSTRTLQYRCSTARQNHGAPDCQVVGGKQINDAVVKEFLAVIKQASDEVLRLAVDELEQEMGAADRMWRHQLEQAEYEAQRAERQYHAVEPENRLVARSLEQRWNATLEHLEQVKSEAQSRQQRIRPLSEHEKARAKHLARDVEGVWQAATTTNRDRKNLLRSVIEEVQLQTLDSYYSVKIVWKGGLATEREVKRRRRGDLPATATPKDTIELVRQLAAELDDAQIACVLGKQGRKTGCGNPFTAHKVAKLRNYNGIPVHERARARHPKQGPFTADEAAAELRVTSSTIHRWLREGILPGSQVTAGAPWRIVLNDELRKKLSHDQAPAGWVGLTEAAKQLGLPKQQLAYLVKRGKLPAVRVQVGTRWYWKIDVKSAAYGRQSSLL